MAGGINTLSIFILNMTGNREGFENDFCTRLDQAISAPTQYVCARGLDLQNNQALQERTSDVLVIVAHAGPKGPSGTSIDTGLFVPSPSVDAGIQEMFKQQLESPTVLMQILGHSSKEKVVIYCACSATSPETIVSIVSLQSCIGVVTSREEVPANDYGLVAKIADSMHQAIQQGVTDYNTLAKEVAQLVEANGNHPDFACYPAFRILEEQ